jgi:hypothetical protein
MPLRPFLEKIAKEYDQKAGTGTALQAHLRGAPSVLADAVPLGYLVEGHGGLGFATATPWIGVLDPDITTSPKRGLYLAYLFSADLLQVTLSLQQGGEDLSSRLGPAAARQALAKDAALLRGALGAETLEGLTVPFDLRFPRWRQLTYQACSIAQMTYRLDSLPPEDHLHDDLLRFLGLLSEAALARRYLAASDPGQLNTPGGDSEPGYRDDPLAHFKPKDSSEYVVTLESKVLVKSRRHEALVDRYGHLAASIGWSPSTGEHPLDLTLRPVPPTLTHDVARVVVEAKVVRRGNATNAVREAIGQLFTYQLLLVEAEERERTPLAAVFSEQIGDAYVGLLDERLGIAAVWAEGSSWRGSRSAHGLQLL